MSKTLPYKRKNISLVFRQTCIQIYAIEIFNLCELQFHYLKNGEIEIVIKKEVLIQLF